MIRQCNDRDFEAIYAIINDAADKYEGIIPQDRCKTPYMSADELRHEIDEGVIFWGFEEGGNLAGVMGIQYVKDVALIRHAYVRSDRQNLGIGQKLLSMLRSRTHLPMLIGTWSAADWAIRFYEKHGFKKVSREEKDRLLKKYWSVPDRQIEASVVLADSHWFDLS
jgi:GNAT superfamily N-acetyltransferase